MRDLFIESDMSENDSKLLTQFKGWVKPPSPVSDRLDSDYLNILRENIHTNAMVSDDGNLTGINYMLRNQQQQLSLLSKGEALCSAAPRQSLPFNGLDGIDHFADGTEILVNYFMKKGGLTQIADGLIQEAMTVPLAWMKLNWIEDYNKDSLGNTHFNRIDTLNSQRFALEERMSAGEFNDDSAEFEELEDIKKSLSIHKARAIRDDIRITPLTNTPIGINPATGQPTGIIEDPRMKMLQDLQEGKGLDSPVEIPHFKGITFEPKYAESIGYDWSITRPEQVYESEWMFQVVPMTRNNVISRFNITGDDLTRLSGSRDKEYDDSHDSLKPSVVANNDTRSKNSSINVYEFWYKPTRTVYYFSDDYVGFLGSEVPEATWEHWYPFFLLQFNRVAGMFAGRSGGELQWSLQEEYNELRLHDREARNASYPRYIVTLGAFQEGELEKLEASLPFQVIEMANADEIKKHFHEVQTVIYEPGKYGVGLQRTRVDMEAMQGLPSSGLGAVGGAELATEVAFAAKSVESQVGRNDRTISKFLADISLGIAEIAYQTLTDDEIRMIVGEGFNIPENRLLYLSSIEFRASINGRPDSTKILSFVPQLLNVASSVGREINADGVLELMLDASDLRLDKSKIMPRQQNPPVVPTPVVEGGGSGGQASSGGTPEPSQIPGNAQTVGAGEI